MKTLENKLANKDKLEKYLCECLHLTCFIVERKKLDAKTLKNAWR